MNGPNETPELNLKMETIQVESKIVHVPWVVITTHMYVCDKNGTRKFRLVSRWKLFKYWLYRITKIRALIKNFNSCK